MKIYRLSLLVLVLFFCACAGYHSGSFTAPDLPVARQQIVVDKVTDRLVAVYPPGRTELALDVMEDDAFGQALERGLRLKGFTLDENSALRLAYTLDSIKDGPNLLWYVHIRLSDGFSFAQAYDLGTNPKPLGGISQIVPGGK